MLGVRREHTHVRVVSSDVAEDRLVLEAQPIVERDDGLERAETRGAPRGRGHLFVVEVGVPRVEEVAVPVAHGDGDMPAGVADRGHEEDVVGEGTHRAEATPGVALGRITPPLRPVGELERAVASALCERGPVHRRVVLGLVDVNGRVGKVGEPSGVIEVEVRDDDIAHVPPVEAEPFDVGERGLLALEPRAGQAEKKGPEPLSGAANVVRAEARVDEHEAIGTLDEQAVRDEPFGRESPSERAPRERTHGAAVEVVNGGHARLFEARGPPARPLGPALPFAPRFEGVSRAADALGRRATGATEASPCACAWSCGCA